MTIVDIARATGVSIATVSRVINASGYVKEETRKKIEAYIEQSNYVPNAIARNLSRQDSSSIGVIIPDIENPFFPKVIHGISEVAEKNQFCLFFFGTDENPQAEHRALGTVREHRVKGVIITPTSNLDRTTRGILQEFRASGIPIVLIDRDLRHSNFDGVFIDNVQGAYDAVRAFVDCGHRRIAIIAGPETSRPGKERLKGFLNAMQDSGCEVPEAYIARGDFRVEQGYKLTRSLMHLPERPTAILSSNNMTTLGSLKYLTEHGYTLGSNISLISFDEIEELNVVNYQLSAVSRPTQEMGRAAMQLLLDRMGTDGAEPEGEARRITFPTKLILRGSEQYNFSNNP